MSLAWSRAGSSLPLKTGTVCCLSERCPSWTKAVPGPKQSCQAYTAPAQAQGIAYCSHTQKLSTAVPARRHQRLNSHRHEGVRIEANTLLLACTLLAVGWAAFPGFSAAANGPAAAPFNLQAAAEQLKALVAQYSDSPAGAFIFAAAYAVLAVFLVPASFLTLAAGYLYGNVKGTALVSVSATLGASLSFVVSRYLARPFVADRLASSRRFQAIDTGIAKSGARIVLLLRLSPIVPYGLCNYMLGLTGIDFVRFVLLSWLGMLPGTFAYVSLGGAGKAGYDASTNGSLDATKFVLYGLGAIASVLAVYLVGRIANDALQVPEEEP